ncbi:MAG: hypothetical protein H6577_17145 [Lewinellaceae bacterium]|nr:hypothetical protein [Saprospiraceae bacterium]MCB9339854.1 hypothetical protein [Lewinellaceae bacterium]
MNFKYFILLFFLTGLGQMVTAQDENEEGGFFSKGRLSGDLTINGNFFMRDSAIGAANIPQYDRQLFGADAWLNLNYNIYGFDIGVRFDMFNNSNLLNPTGTFSGRGIGRWYINKKIHKLGISGGYLYDVIGSGIIFRAYEERALAIDQALYGIRLTYDLLPNWKVKAFTGVQKRQFTNYESVLRGISIDGFIAGDSTSTLSLAPGFGIVARGLDDATMNSLVATLNTYSKEDVYEPKYNAYAMTFYNTLTAGAFNWYVEGAFKTKDSMFDPFKERITTLGDTVVGRYIQGTGSVIYSSLSFSKSGFALTLEGKRTENFDFRASPLEAGIRGLLHYIPPMAKVNTYRLPARYAAVTQFIGELGFQADLRYRFSKSFSANVNVSNITNLDNVQLYREVFTEFYYKFKRKWTLTAGVQLQEYNQEVYFGKPDAPKIKTFTPYLDYLYKLNRKTSLRFEAQYMNVAKDDGIRADYGNWLFGLLEFSVAPHWTITLSDMYNISPGKISPVDAGTGKKEKIHYPRVDVFFTHHANRFSLSYVKQVEGIVCSGGICRLEPAFSGVKVGINSTF